MRKKEKLETNAPNQSYPAVWLVIVLVVVLDQLTKWFAGHFLTVVKNTGTIFGLFSSHPLLIFCLTVVILGFFLRFLILKQRDEKTRRVLLFASMLVAGGGISNMLDRLLRGYVIDFLKLPLWPTFNLADFSITCGVTLLLWFTLVKKDQLDA